MIALVERDGLGIDSGRKDYAASEQPFTRFEHRAIAALPPCGECGHVTALKECAIALGMLGHPRNQFGPRDAAGKSGDIVRARRQQGARALVMNDTHAAPVACEVECSCQTRGAATDHKHIVHCISCFRRSKAGPCERGPVRLVAYRIIGRSAILTIHVVAALLALPRLGS
jgi:hypothetical protein